mmetsp:Transcript_25288/g.99865  ORF Transcript_25288/g.99865 Transcript_25288/m.99865 type:complete len:97 (+) Transcript_25288:1111-1401(+)
MLRLWLRCALQAYEAGWSAVGNFSGDVQLSSNVHSRELVCQVLEDVWHVDPFQLFIGVSAALANDRTLRVRPSSLEFAQRTEYRATIRAHPNRMKI